MSKTVKISKKSLLKLLADNDHMANQIDKHTARETELIAEIRELKKTLEAVGTIPVIDPAPFCDPFDAYDPLDPLNPAYDPTIYIDNQYSAE